MYVRTVQDSNFGSVELYRKGDIEYIMKKTFTFIHNDCAADELRKCMRFIEKNRHSSLPTVHCVTLKKGTSIGM